MPEHIRDFLIRLGVADQPHSGRTFLQHCEGVYRLLLSEHGYDIALAGALHSVYGTESYRPQSIPTRAQVRELVGREAEELAWLFCTLKRKQIRALAWIDRANEMEQKCH
jgi:hypothetical protein